MRSGGGISDEPMELIAFVDVRENDTQAYVARREDRTQAVMCVRGIMTVGGCSTSTVVLRD